MITAWRQSRVRASPSLTLYFGPAVWAGYGPSAPSRREPLWHLAQRGIFWEL